MTNNEFAVLIEGVSKSFGPQLAVDNLDLRISPGTIQGIIGPNGSGKTTTIRMILRIFQPDTGTVTVLDRPQGWTADDRVGYLPEERGLYPRMRVRDTLRFFAQIKGLRKPDQEIDRWLERLDATQWSHKKIESLSKGMAQKIQFIAAVVSRPKLLILDEPFSGLDPVNLDLFKEVVGELRSQGTTILLCTHDVSAAERLCDRVAMLYKGRKVLDGTIEEIQSKYGDAKLRVRLANNSAIDVSKLPDIVYGTDCNPFMELGMKSLESRHRVLHALAEQGDIEHFETIKPKLHDIFVSIAKPISETKPLNRQEGNPS